MAANSNLHSAKKAKQDEFYTQLSDIEDELKNYKHHFKDKVVYLNCDDPETSNFFYFFRQKFHQYGLKRLIATSYAGGILNNSIARYYKYDGASLSIRRLNGDGDFRSDESVEILKQADIVVTNPPFSLFREYVAQLMEHGKKFLIIGNMNAITYKEIFPLIKENRLWLGINNGPKKYAVPDTYKGNTVVEDVTRFAKLGNTNWFTNLSHKKRNSFLDLHPVYDPDEYPRYDNYDAINVDRVAGIPKDYYEPMGVPITFLDKYNPDQFEILKFRKGDDDKDLRIGNKELYFRIVIQRR